MRTLRAVLVALVASSFSLPASADSLPPSMRAKLAPKRKEATKVKVRRIEQIKPVSTVAPAPRGALAGDHPIAVVLLETQDARFKDAAAARAKVEQLFFAPAGLSARTYYEEGSYGLYHLGGKVLGPVRVKGRLGDYAYGPGMNGAAIAGLVQLVFADVADELDMAVFDTHTIFGEPRSDGIVDHLSIIFATNDTSVDGYFKPIWPHRGSIEVEAGGKRLAAYTIFSITNPLGTVVHEFGHDIGLPDLYDQDDSSHGAGLWCLMAAGSWLEQGARPGHISAWGKVRLGWVRPTLVARSQTRVEIPAVETQPVVLKIPIGEADAKEYFLVENRQRVGFDQGLRDEGLLVWHIDDTVKHNDDETHKLVDLVEPDAIQDLDVTYSDSEPDYVDTFRAGKKTRFDDASSPSSRSYSGKPTGITIAEVSTSKTVMTADFEVPTISVPDGEPFTLQQDNYQYGTFGFVSLPDGTEELTSLEATDGAFDAREVETLVVARPHTSNKLTLTLYADDRGKPGAKLHEEPLTVSFDADSYAWVKARLSAPVRIEGKQRFWAGVRHEGNQVGVAYNPASVSKRAGFRGKKETKLTQQFRFSKGAEPVPDYILRVAGYGFIGLDRPEVPQQADESDEVIQRMREADALLDAKKFLEAEAGYETVLARMEQDPKPYLTWIPVIHNALGVAAYQAKRYDIAIEFFHRSLKRAQQLGDVEAEADLLENIGETHFHAGRLAEAEEYCQRSHAMNASRPDRLLESAYWLGRITTAKKEKKQAAAFFAQAKSLVGSVHPGDKELYGRWLARIDRGLKGTAEGEDPVEGESRLLGELQEERAIEAAPDAPSSAEVHRVNLGDFGVGP
jgi:M6 family metalloprotease-like protein